MSNGRTGRVFYRGVAKRSGAVYYQNAIMQIKVEKSITLFFIKTVMVFCSRILAGASVFFISKQFTIYNSFYCGAVQRLTDAPANFRRDRAASRCWTADAARLAAHALQPAGFCTDRAAARA